MRYLVFLLILSGCAKEHVREVSIDPAVAPYVTRFQVEAVNQDRPIAIADLRVEFAIMIKDGNCHKGDNETPVVDISVDLWTSLSPEDKEVLVFHELGHCLLNREHRMDLDHDVPVSIMFPDSLRVSGYVEYYRSHRAAYMTELFN